MTCVDPISGKSTGEIRGATCHRCFGSGWRQLIVLRVNPAGISGTRYFGVNEDPDPVSATIDRTVAGWSQSNLTYWLYRVVLMQYASGGTQETKALKMRVSTVWFRKNLREAHLRVQDSLESKNSR